MSRVPAAKASNVRGRTSTRCTAWSTIAAPESGLTPNIMLTSCAATASTSCLSSRAHEAGSVMNVGVNAAMSARTKPTIAYTRRTRRARTRPISASSPRATSTITVIASPVSMSQTVDPTTDNPTGSER